MEKTHRLDLRVSDNLRQKIDTVTKEMGISKTDFIRSVLEEKCDQILMGKSSENHAEYLERMLHDIGRRIAYVQSIVDTEASSKATQDQAHQFMGNWEEKYRKKSP